MLSAVWVLEAFWGRCACCSQRSCSWMSSLPVGTLRCFSDVSREAVSPDQGLPSLVRILCLCQLWWLHQRRDIWMFLYCSFSLMRHLSALYSWSSLSYPVPVGRERMAGHASTQIAKVALLLSHHSCVTQYPLVTGYLCACIFSVRVVCADSSFSFPASISLAGSRALGRAFVHQYTWCSFAILFWSITLHLRDQSWLFFKI